MGGRGSGSGFRAGGSNPTTRTIGSDSEAVDFEISEFQKWRDGLSPAELQAAQEYALDSTLLNAYIRGDGPAPRGMDADQRIADLDAAISHPLSTGLTVFRGVGTNYLGMDLSNEDAIKALVGKTVRDKAFMSTALTQEVGETYGRGVVFKISVPKGTKAMNPDIAENSAAQLRDYLADGDAGNTELVFRRNTGLKITGYTRRTGHDGRQYWEIQAQMK